MSKFYDENTLGLYMMFKVEEYDGENIITAYKEGDSKHAYVLRNENLENYIKHLDYMIQGCEKRLQIFNRDSKIMKQLDKYKLYKKRLENAISKLNKAS